MSDLTDRQIAILSDIGAFDMSALTAQKRADFEYLLTASYVEPVEGHPGSRFKLTKKAIQFLGERGAGLNES